MANDLNRLLDVARQSLGLDEQQSRKLENGIRHEFGSQNLYVDAGLSKRDQEIRSAFNGRNHKELGVMFGLTERQIYNIVR